MINITTTVVIIKSGVSRVRLEPSFADTMDKAEPGNARLRLSYICA